MPDPRTDAFWQAEGSKLWETLRTLAMTILLAGAESGLELLPPSLQILVDWEAFSGQALDYLHRYQLDTVAKINETTRTRAIAEIDRWIQSGEPLSSLDARLTPIFGETRAASIASTEVTRIYAKGNLEVWNTTGFISGKRWMTARDARVCPLCGPLHNKVVQISGNYQQSVQDIANSPQMRLLVGDDPQRRMRRAMSLTNNSGFISESPPRHPRCRCWLQPIVDVDAFREFTAVPLVSIYAS